MLRILIEFIFSLWFGILFQAAASPVLENMIDEAFRENQRSSEKMIRILGVPGDAVEVFVRFIYSNRSVTSILQVLTF